MEGVHAEIITRPPIFAGLHDLKGWLIGSTIGHLLLVWCVPPAPTPTVVDRARTAPDVDIAELAGEPPPDDRWAVCMDAPGGAGHAGPEGAMAVPEPSASVATAPHPPAVSATRGAGVLVEPGCPDDDGSLGDPWMDLELPDDALDRMTEIESHEMTGAVGLGAEGEGYGGGGGWGLIGRGSYGTLPDRGAGNTWRLRPCASSSRLHGATARPAPVASRPRVTVGADYDVSGTLGHRVVHRRVKRAVATIRRCYVERLAGDSELTGAVAAHFVIGTAGGVTASAGGTDRALESCVVRALEGLSFRARDIDGVVTARGVMFRFDPG